MEWVGANCGVKGLSHYAQRRTVEYVVVTELLVKCIEHGNTLMTALSRRIAAPSRSSASAIAAASSFGSQRLMRYLLAVAGQLPPAPASHASGHRPTPLHTAALRGWPMVASQLVKHGYDKHAHDQFGHSPLQIACLQRWSKVELEAAFGEGTHAACLAAGHLDVLRPSTLPPAAAAEPGGGWIDGSRWLQAASQKQWQLGKDDNSCQFDVVEGGITRAEFQRDYISVRR